MQSCEPGLAYDGQLQFRFVNGVLTITKADQTITFLALAAKTVGNPPFALSYRLVRARSVVYKFQSALPRLPVAP